MFWSRQDAIESVFMSQEEKRRRLGAFFRRSGEF
jgi:hypothetical protein